VTSIGDSAFQGTSVTIPAPDAAPINKLLTPEQLAVSEAFTNGIGMVMVPIPAGEFQMGSPDRQEQHLVKIVKPFYLSAFEVTQEQHGKVMGTAPRSSSFLWRGHVGARKAMTMLNYDGAVKFCEKLSALPEERAANREYRLPTEAEWEYACRAGTTTTHSFGNDPLQLDEYAWHLSNSGRQIHSVGQKKPNSWGLYDMYGNVEEWCRDWYGKLPSASTTIDPIGPDEGSRRVVRGGSCGSAAKWCTSAGRGSMRPASYGDTRGIRVIMVPSGSEAAKPNN
jgi:formylglycine-generating enzyme required for sulfatase activity